MKVLSSTVFETSLRSIEIEIRVVNASSLEIWMKL